MSNFDERCPHCNEKQEVYEAFVSSDYQNEFSYECSHCEKWICVDGTCSPDFELSKPIEIKPRDRWGYGLPKEERTK